MKKIELKKEPFRRYSLEEEQKEKPDIITIRLNKEERASLDRAKKIIQQPKDSTALKTLTEIGTNVLHDSLTGSIIRTVFKNKAKNQRTGIVDFE